MVVPVQNMPLGGAGGVQEIVWEAVTTAGSPHTSQRLGGTQSIAGSVQVVGTFGGATVVLQASNDNSNWVTMKDVTGTDISFTSAGMVEFSTAASYIRVSSSGGTGDDVDVTVSLRG